jgi:hypothetical protein
MQRLDAHPIDQAAHECRVVMVVRNEVLRLPWIVHYYRKLGVVRFFVIDNGSTDGTVDFLLKQKDCHVFHTLESYAAANSGVKWQTEILRTYNNNHWWLIVDADEMLVYPSSETVKISDLCRYLESQNVEALYAMFIDMYGKGSVAESHYSSGQNFLDVCPCFDSDYRFAPRAKAPFASTPFPEFEPFGGPRFRRFYSEYHASGRGGVTRAKYLRQMRSLLAKFGVRIFPDLAIPPLLFKVPLIKWRETIQHYNAHVISRVRLAPVTGALLHFKFFGDFHARVVTESARKEHYDGASEYARYARALRADPTMGFAYEKTAIYQNSDQLVNLNLINDDETFRTFRTTL